MKKKHSTYARKIKLFQSSAMKKASKKILKYLKLGEINE